MAKFGKCAQCPAGTREQPLINDLCGYHHNLKVSGAPQPTKKELVQQHKEERAEIKAEKAANPTPVQVRKMNTEHIDKMWLQNPGHCENCGAKLETATDYQRRSAVCHIVPKNPKMFPSVARHPKNRWFGCMTCHHDYDDKGWSHAVTMKVWPICLERFELFKAEIDPVEWSRLPDVLRSKIDENGYKPVQPDKELQV